MIDNTELAKLRWRLSFGNRKVKQVSEPYRTQKFLLERAKVVPRPEARCTVSAFAGWVFDLCHEPRGDREYSRYLGKLAERVVSRSYKIPRAKSSDRLKVLFQDPLTGRHSGFKISALTVDGRSLWGVPDLIAKDKDSDAIVIFERKATRYRVPEDGWPNLRVQLWCYSWIDQLISCDAVILIGQIWRWRDRKLHLSNTIPWWSRADPVFNAECEELFAAYGGEFSLPNI